MSDADTNPNSNIITKTLNNLELSLLVSDFWDESIAGYDVTAPYKKIRKDLILEYIEDTTERNGIIEQQIYFCYYWHDDSLQDIMKLKIEPAMMHKFLKKYLEYCFVRRYGKKYHYKYKFNFFKDTLFIKNTIVVLKEKKPNINQLLKG
jgi:hypothetical protein